MCCKFQIFDITVVVYCYYKPPITVNIVKMGKSNFFMFVLFLLYFLCIESDLPNVLLELYKMLHFLCQRLVG